jgi:PqqD family protein of HPr-rel-A system
MLKKVVAKETDSELMLYDPDQDAVHILNATALLVYKLYSEGKSLDEIEHEVRRKFAVGPNENVQQGLRKCLAELREKGLVPGVEGDAPG